MLIKGLINSFRILGRAAILSGALLPMLCSCTEEFSDPPIAPAAEEARVILNISTPKGAAAGAGTRGAEPESETAVRQVDILVLHDPQGDGGYTFAYKAGGSLLAHQPNGSTRFEAKLRTADVPLKLLILANAAPAFGGYTPQVGEGEASVRASLEMEFPPDGMQGYLPMYGEVSLPGIDAGVTNVVNATVLRAVARVDVTTDLEAGSPSFAVSEVRIYRANDRLRLIPAEDVAAGGLRVSSPTVPSAAAPLGQPVIKSLPAPADSLGGLYLPESLSFSDSEQRRTTATTVVVGGIFGDDTDVTYYRVDFNSGVEGHPFGQVLRNYLYTFTVKKVAASGWPTPEDAASNLAASMTVDVQPWEDFTSEMYFHESYIGVSTRSVRVPFLPNYTQTVDVESTMNYSMRWLDTPSAGSVSQAGVPLSDGYFTATIVRDAAESDMLTHIRIESPQYNTADDEITATLRLTANDTSIDIRVVKESPALYSGRAFQVMSMGTSYGSLGDYATPVTYTQAMRRVLDVNFAPDSKYPFRIGGFFYLTVPISTTVYSASTSASDIAYYKKMIDNTDILMLSYTNFTSVQVADMLFDEWLVEKPNRVLWVMMDSAPYNAGVYTRFQREGMGTWVELAGKFNADNGYRAASPSDFGYDNGREAGQFFDGPFGTVEEGSLLYYSDVIARIVDLPDSVKRKITPLVYNNTPPYDHYMSVGVETRRGVVYQGESQLFQGGVGMSGMAGNSAQVNGTIVSEPQVSGTTERYYLDVLNANIWAWAVGRVIYGPPPD